MKIRCLLIVTTALCLMFPLTAPAQVSLDDLDDGALRYLAETGDFDAFGISTAETSSYSSRAFVSNNLTAFNHLPSSYGYRYLSGSGGGTVTMDLPVGTDLPLGALVGAVCAHVYDSDSSNEVRIGLWQYEQPSSSTKSPANKQLGSYDGSGVAWSAGYTQICTLPLTRLRTLGDINSDGNSGTLSYEVVLYFDDNTTQLKHGAVTVLWQRQLSPAPATASFTDVPTGHWAFQYVEALVDSGVTAGCGGGNFCPDESVTRAQMAVFLAKALGLHFIN